MLSIASRISSILTRHDLGGIDGLARIASRNCRFKASRVARSTGRPRSASRYSFTARKRNMPTGHANSTRRSTSLSGPASSRATEPKTAGCNIHPPQLGRVPLQTSQNLSSRHLSLQSDTILAPFVPRDKLGIPERRAGSHAGVSARAEPLSDTREQGTRGGWSSRHASISLHSQHTGGHAQKRCKLFVPTYRPTRGGSKIGETNCEKPSKSQEVQTILLHPKSRNSLQTIWAINTKYRPEHMALDSLSRLLRYLG